MDPGPAMVVLVLVGAGIIAVIPKDTLKALGGLMIAITIIAIVIDAVRLLSR